ncbi:MAG: A/G-specific adenine glycosylase [Acidobacteriota bacterium]
MRLPPRAGEIRSLRRRLLSWYEENRRDLPWRRQPDPYGILVSEVMLQQTTVATVVPFYERFMARFPDPSALAEAPEQEVMGLWSGLGYYARARRLRQACAEVVARHGGRIPATYRELIDLPGVGPYTAGAVSSIAFGRQEPAVDGNVHRVLCRLAGQQGGSTWHRELMTVARRLVRGPSPGDLNQAVMELGAVVCTPRNPACAGCPVAATCRARRSGRPEDFPRPKIRPAREPRRGGVLVVRDQDQKICLVRRPAGRLLGELLAFPGLCGYEADPVEATPSSVLAAASMQLGCPLTMGPHIATIRHQVLNRAVTLEVWHGARGKRRPSAPRRQAEGRWETVPYRPGDPAPRPMTAACLKVLAVLNGSPGQRWSSKVRRRRGPRGVGQARMP